MSAKEDQRKWREKNPGYRKEWHVRNPGKQAEYDQRSRLKNIEKHRDRLKSWKARNPDKAFALDLKKYGITVDRFHELIVAQSGRCAICGKSFTYGQRGLNVDHDHITGRVRGLLCANCNLGLGSFGDDLDTIRAAMLYLVIS